MIQPVSVGVWGGVAAGAALTLGGAAISLHALMLMNGNSVECIQYSLLRFRNLRKEEGWEYNACVLIANLGCVLSMCSFIFSCGALLVNVKTLGVGAFVTAAPAFVVGILGLGVSNEAVKYVGRRFQEVHS